MLGLVQDRQDVLLAASVRKRNRLLQDDRTGVDSVVDEVHRDAADLHAVRDLVLDRVGSREGWQQRRMDVDDARGKRLVVVDDSIVRGNTMRQIVQMLREAGAKEVHLRMSSPPIRHPCHYGIDMPTREEMIAHGRSIKEVAEVVGADSLAYLSLDGVYEAIGSDRTTHCDACFTGDYPLEGTEQANGKHALEELAVIRA